MELDKVFEHRLMCEILLEDHPCCLNHFYQGVLLKDRHKMLHSRPKDLHSPDPRVGWVSEPLKGKGWIRYSKFDGGQIFPQRAQGLVHPFQLEQEEED